MEKVIPHIGLIISCLYGGIYYFVGPFPEMVDLCFFGIGMVLFGIPHGAGDHLIVRKRSITRGKQFNLIRFVALYLLVMALYAGLWTVYPSLSFGLFILISVFHFGDMEHLHPEINQAPLKYVFDLLTKICLGTGILGWILSTHLPEVRQILSDFAWSKNLVSDPYTPYICFGLILVGYQKSNLALIMNTTLTLVIGSYLPLLPAFICYFAFCHAIYSLLAMSTYLRISFNQLLQKLIPFSLLALALGAAYLQLPVNQNTIFYVFVFLSILTLPHFFLMHTHLKK